MDIQYETTPMSPPLVPFFEEQRRHRRAGALSAALVGAPLATADPGYTWREVAGGTGWVGVGALILGEVVAVSAVGAAAVLYLLGWLLNRMLVALPAWVAAT